MVLPPKDKENIMDIEGRKLKGRGNVTVTREDDIYYCGMYKTRRGYYLGLVVFYVLILALIGACWAYSGCAATPSVSPAVDVAYELPDMISSVRGSVVHIRADGGQGSGVCVLPGIVITARHVTDGYRGPYEITFQNGEIYQSDIVWEDAGNDVSYLRFEQDPNHFIEYPTLQQTLPRVGDRVVVFGSPLGYDFFNTASPGYVTAIERSLHDVLDEYSTERRFLWLDMIQMNAPSYPGNSGGPVFNEDGEVVGILVAGYDPTLCFAVSAESIHESFMQALLDLQKGVSHFVDITIPEYQDYPY